MLIDGTLTEVVSQLTHGDVAARRAAVRQAADLLKQPDCAQPCRDQLIAALRAAGEGDSAFTVRDLAQDVLSNLPTPAAASLLPFDRQHMLGVRCPNGHVTDYDKRRICLENTIVVRSLVRDAAGQTLDEFAQHHVLFQSEDQPYMAKLFATIS